MAMPQALRWLRQRRRLANACALLLAAAGLAVPATVAAWLAPGGAGRRAAIFGAVGSSVGLGLLDLDAVPPARADIVTAPLPPKGYGLDNWKSGNMGKARKCMSVAECQELGQARELEQFGATEASVFSKTKSGVRYKDLVAGNKEDGIAENGKELSLRYKVMRQGKRSSDGLSGEATTIFSLGFGEDDGPKDALLTAKLGEGKFVKALEEGLVGMAVGATRRIQVRPDYGLGWKKSGKCADAIIGVGVVAGLPMGGAENQNNCLDDSLLPQPMDYGEKRRFARRFDESLILEIQLVKAI